MKQVRDLAYTVYQHDALNNKFYHIWMPRTLNINKLKIFVSNYWEWTFRFPEALAGLIMSAKDIDMRTECTKTLFSEMGNGHIKHAHSLLFENFSNSLSHQLGEDDGLNFKSLKIYFSLLPTTQNLINWQKETYQKNLAVADGAQLALEWQAYTMICNLYEGARNYMALWPMQDKFHEACEFFYAHRKSP